jgi:predicted component of type VI protein secretion system
VFRIGRHPSNDFVIQDRAAEDFHCVLFHENGEVWIEDLQTRYGVVVNGSRVQQALLRSSDTVQIGFTRIDWGALLGQSKIHPVIAEESSFNSDAAQSIDPEIQTIEENSHSQQETISNTLEYALRVPSNPYANDIRSNLLEIVHKQRINKETDIPEFPESIHDFKSDAASAPIHEESIQTAVELDVVKLEKHVEFKGKLSFEQRMIRLTIGLIIGMGMLGWLFGRAMQ